MMKAPTSNALKGFGSIGPVAQPKLKTQQSAGVRDEAKGDPFDSIDLTALQTKAAEAPVLQPSNVPAKATRGKEASAKPVTTAKARTAAIPTAPDAAATKDIGARPPRQPRVQDVSPERSDCQQQEPPKPAVQPAGRRSRPGSQRNSTSTTAGPRTGEEIWQLNLALGKIAEQLADPDDAKQGRRRYKSPTLQEKLHKQWGGTYGDKLEKELAPMDVEEPPAPKYEPPTFLDDAHESEQGEDLPRSSDDNLAGEDEQAVSERPGPQQQPEGPCPAPATKPSGVKPQGGQAAGSRRAVPPGAKRGIPKPAAAPVVVTVDDSADEEEERGNDAEARDGGSAAGDDVVANDTSTSGRELAQTRDEQQPRRGTRKTKAAAVEAAAKAAPKRPATRRTARTAAGSGPAAEASADAAAEQPAESDTDAMEPQPSTAAGQGRARKSHLPPNVTFSTGPAYKPSLPPVASTADNPGEEAGTDGAAAGASGAAVSKRVRDAAAAGDDKARQSKALRLEQQKEQQKDKELEALKQRLADQENKAKEQADTIKALQAEAKANEKRVVTAEKAVERQQEQLKEKEGQNMRLKEEYAALKEENKQLKQDLAKWTKRWQEFDTLYKRWQE